MHYPFIFLKFLIKENYTNLKYGIKKYLCIYKFNISKKFNATTYIHMVIGEFTLILELTIM